MDNLILTVDQAFRGTNFLILQRELDLLNPEGIYDEDFFQIVHNFIETPEAWQNLKDACGITIQ